MYKGKKGAIGGIVTILGIFLLLGVIIAGSYYGYTKQQQALSLPEVNKLRDYGTPGTAPNTEWECHWLRTLPLENAGDEFSKIRPCSDILKDNGDGTLTISNNLIASLQTANVRTKLNLFSMQRVQTIIDTETGLSNVKLLVDGKSSTCEYSIPQTAYIGSTPLYSATRFTIDIVSDDLDPTNVSFFGGGKEICNIYVPETSLLQLSFTTNQKSAETGATLGNFKFTRPGIEPSFACTYELNDALMVWSTAGPQNIDLFSLEMPRIKFCPGDAPVLISCPLGFDSSTSILERLNRGEQVSLKDGCEYIFVYSFDNSPDANGVRPVTTSCDIKTQFIDKETKACVDRAIAFTFDNAVIDIEKETISVSSEIICTDADGKPIQDANLVKSSAVNGVCPTSAKQVGDVCYQCTLNAPSGQYCQELTLNNIEGTCKPKETQVCPSGWETISQEPLDCKAPLSVACDSLGGMVSNGQCKLEDDPAVQVSEPIHEEIPKEGKQTSGMIKLIAIIFGILIVIILITSIIIYISRG